MNSSNIDMIKVLGSVQPRYRKAIIKSADKQLVGAICECIYNTLQGKIVLNDTEKEKLKRYKRPMRKLIERSNLKSKKKILIQSGGFLQFLLPAVVTGLSSIVSSIISASEK